MLKTWMQSNDIKDKSALMENRKLIEVVSRIFRNWSGRPSHFMIFYQQMERFKASEKELKTKAFSKEGLIAASRLDPAEKAKLELSQWISGMVDELGRQVETTEAEIEQLAGGTKKKKGGTSNERAAQLDQLNDRRKWHSSRLEILLRMLENGTLETDRVSDIKEDIIYFVESNADEDFEEDEGIYDEFNLDEEEEAFGLKDNEDISNQDTVSIPDGK
jgi:CCR4-NOT transcription complex subunit 3